MHKAALLMSFGLIVNSSAALAAALLANARGEALPGEWRIDGTTGYDTAARLGGLFVDPSAEAALTKSFEQATETLAGAPSPDYADFDACQALAFALYSVFFDEVGGLPRARVLHEDWPSQMPDSGTMTQRGQVWRGIIELQQGVSKLPGQFAPIGVSGQFTVEPVNPASGDPIVITIA